jgi:hypothetical protein
MSEEDLEWAMPAGEKPLKRLGERRVPARQPVETVC